MSDWDCRSELVVKERRGPLSAPEQMALEAHLAQCGSCRLSRLVGQGFEVGVNVEPGDGMRIAALAATARRWAAGNTGVSARPPRRRVAGRVMLFAATLALASAGASAAGGMLFFGSSNENSAHGGGPTVAAPAAPAAPATAAPRTRLAEPTPEARDEAPPTSERTEPKLAAGARSVTASALFQKASDARRAGEARRAVTLYRQLHADFPGSPEATLSRVPLGGLLLDTGDARGALAEYDRYLSGAGTQSLAPEALYGRGRALGKLGNAEAEERTWHELLLKFGKSPYAAHARRRLEQLSGSAAPPAP